MPEVQGVFFRIHYLCIREKTGESDTDTSSPAQTKQGGAQQKINLTLLTTGQQHTEDLSSTQLGQISQHLERDLNLLAPAKHQS